MKQKDKRQESEKREKIQVGFSSVSGEELIAVEVATSLQHDLSDRSRFEFSFGLC